MPNTLNLVTSKLTTEEVSSDLRSSKPLLLTLEQLGYTPYSVEITPEDFSVAGRSKLALTIPDGYCMSMVVLQVSESFDGLGHDIEIGDGSNRESCLTGGIGTQELTTPGTYYGDDMAFDQYQMIADGADKDVYIWPSASTLPTEGAATLTFYCIPFSKLTVEVTYEDFSVAGVTTEIGSYLAYEIIAGVTVNVTESFDGVPSCQIGTVASPLCLVTGTGTVDLTATGSTSITTRQVYNLEGPETVNFIGLHTEENAPTQGAATITVYICDYLGYSLVSPENIYGVKVFMVPNLDLLDDSIVYPNDFSLGAIELE